jgi:hypothetical protein
MQGAQMSPQMMQAWGGQTPASVDYPNITIDHPMFQNENFQQMLSNLGWSPQDYLDRWQLRHSYFRDPWEMNKEGKLVDKFADVRQAGGLASTAGQNLLMQRLPSQHGNMAPMPQTTGMTQAWGGQSMQPMQKTNLGQGIQMRPRQGLGQPTSGPVKIAMRY